MPGIENYRLHPVKIVGFVESQDEQGGLAGNGYLHLVGNRKSGAAIPMLLGRKNTRHRLYYGLLWRLKQRIMPHVIG